MSKEGVLRVVGLGFQLGQVSLETAAQIECAESLLYLASDPLTEYWLLERSNKPVNLFQFYVEGKDRLVSYKEMVEAILIPVREGKRTCAAFYGHPGFFAFPGREAIKQARDEGYNASMLPGISTEDCLFLDLETDPVNGKQAYEASDFLIRRLSFDPSVPLILWQAGALGLSTWSLDNKSTKTLPILQSFLLETYPASHPVILYEATFSAICKPRIDKIELSELSQSSLTPITTLFFPSSADKPPADGDIQNQLRQALESMSNG